jgi:hypothetical protein
MAASRSSTSAEPAAGATTGELVLFTGPGCDLCEDALATIQRVIERRGTEHVPVPVLRVVDIDSDPALRSVYGHRIPVVRLGGRELDLLITPRRLARFLERVLDGVAAA